MKKVMIEFKNVTKIYGQDKVPAVDKINLKIYEGELVVLVGPSGCGKTTTMKMINRLIESTEGEIVLDGKDISQVDPLQLRRNIGYVIQHTGLFPHLTVGQNIATVPKLKKWSKKAIDNKVAELLKLVGLEPKGYMNKLPRQLSGGQQQRIGVARALAADPPVMLMDEPFGALDPITRNHLQDEFLKIQQNVRKTIVFVTHDIDEAVKMGNKIAAMREGEIIQCDTPAAILKTPADQFISNLTGDDRAIKYLSLFPVSNVMSTDKVNQMSGYAACSVDIDSSIKDALISMLDNGSTQIPVAKSNNRIIGSVSLNRIIKTVSNNDHLKALSAM